MSICPVCDSEKSREIGEKNKFRVFHCLKCRSVFTERTSNEIEYYDYSDYYEEGNLTVPDFVKQSLRKTIATFKDYKQNKRLLDVGCGAGILLETACEMGWQAEGVEVSAPSVKYLCEKNFKVFHGTLHEAAYPDNYFDVVTATEVIEHVDNPKELLREISRILRPKGLLWMTTPHANGISIKMMKANWSVVCPPEHLHLFSKEGLEFLLNENGFTKCRFATHGINPFEILRYFRYSGNNDVPTKQYAHNQQETSFDRVKSSYALNSWFSDGKGKEQIKDVLNSLINAAKLGDTLKVWATLQK